MKRIDFAVERVPGAAFGWPRLTRRVYTTATYAEVEVSALGWTLLLSIRTRENNNAKAKCRCAAARHDGVDP